MSAAEVLGRYRLRQSENCFRLGRESLLLSRFATLRPGFAVCDLGCGIGTLLLLLSEREADIGRWGIELDPEAAALARENLAENGLEGRIVQADLRRPGLLPASHFQLVISNPPYFAKGSGKSGGGARMEENLSLPELCRTAMRLLRARGASRSLTGPSGCPRSSPRWSLPTLRPSGCSCSATGGARSHSPFWSRR